MGHFFRPIPIPWRFVPPHPMGYVIQNTALRNGAKVPSDILTASKIAVEDFACFLGHKIAFHITCFATYISAQQHFTSCVPFFINLISADAPKRNRMQ